VKKRLWPWGCVIPGLLVVLLLAAGGAWWFLRSRAPSRPAQATSPVHVILLSPSDGQEVTAGDAVQVQLQVVAPEPITGAELFVDGKSIGAVSGHAESASWIWQAWRQEYIRSIRAAAAAKPANPRVWLQHPRRWSDRGGLRSQTLAGSGAIWG
jgi:hypothetical protein